MIQHRILRQQRCIYIEIRRAPTVKDFKAATRVMVNDPLYRDGYNRVVDATQANLAHITIPDLVDFSEFAKDNISMSGKARVAVVVQDSQRAGVFRAFAEMIGRGNFKVFYDPMQARDWVNEGPHYFRDDGSFCKVLGGVA